MYDYSPIVYYYGNPQEVCVSFTRSKVEILSFHVDKELINKILNVLISTGDSFGSFSVEEGPNLIYVTRHTFTVFDGNQTKFVYEIDKRLFSLLEEIGQFLNCD